MDAEHVPVLQSEALELLRADRGGLFVDVTLGLGGHAEAVLRASPATRLLGLDRDPQALAIARERLAPFGDRVQFVESNFDRLAEAVEAAGWGRPLGILADLGVSSLQLDRAARGFSFRREGPLDMRMGRGGLSAADVVNQYPEAELARIFHEYGEERDARRIARAIGRARQQGPLETTSQLAAVIRDSKRLTPSERAKEGRVDPATRVFQGLRIEVNQELAALPEMLRQAVDMLESDGHLVVISYHSLEDRIVKNTFRDLARGEVDAVTGRPRGETQLIEVLTKRPVRPSDAEVAANPRSRSARLRAARRLERA